MIGDQRHTEALEAGRIRPRGLVGEHCRSVEAVAKAACGVATRENADMSSDMAGEIPARRKPKVSWGRFVLPGLVGT
jgi:hypothetical protein